MNTTTKCQHAMVFTTLAVILIIVACVAFLSPVRDFSVNYVEPVTQVVPSPSRSNKQHGAYGEYWDDETTKRHTTKTSDRDQWSDDETTKRHTTKRTSSHYQESGGSGWNAAAAEGLYDSNQGMHEDSHTRSTTKSTRTTTKLTTKHTTQGQPTVGPNTNPNIRSDTPIAVLMTTPPVATASHGKSNDHDRNRRSSRSDKDEKNQGQSQGKSQGQSQGHVMVNKNHSRPEGEQMQVAGSVGELMPGQVYAVSMHQYGDMQNGCESMGPAFNEGKEGKNGGQNKRRDKDSESGEHMRNKRSKKSKTKEEESNEMMPEMEGDWRNVHNGSLMGFFRANETGHGNFSFPVPMAHQEACAECGGVMGRGVNIRPVHGMPESSGMSSMGGGEQSHKHGKEGKDGDWSENSKSPHNEEEFMKVMNGRKKRSSKYTTERYNNDYQHRSHHSEKIPIGEITYGEPSVSDVGGVNVTTVPFDIILANDLAKNGTVNGTVMYGYMGCPTACGVFARVDMDLEMDQY